MSVSLLPLSAARQSDGEPLHMAGTSWGTGHCFLVVTCCQLLFWQPQIFSWAFPSVFMYLFISCLLAVPNKRVGSPALSIPRMARSVHGSVPASSTSRYRPVILECCSDPTATKEHDGGEENQKEYLVFYNKHIVALP